MKKYDGVLKRVRMLEEKKGIKYATTDSGIYKILKWLCILSAAWGLATNLLFILGNLLMYSGSDYMKNITGQIITVSVCSVSIIQSLILNKFKIHIIGLIINILSSVFLSLQFANLLLDDFGFLGLKTSFYVRHFIPLALMSLLFICMAIIAVRARIKTNRMYKKVTENLYEMYRLSGADIEELSDDKWDEFLKNYDPSKSTKIVVDEEDSSDEE